MCCIIKGKKQHHDKFGVMTFACGRDDIQKGDIYCNSFGVDDGTAGGGGGGGVAVSHSVNQSVIYTLNYLVINVGDSLLAQTYSTPYRRTNNMLNL